MLISGDCEVDDTFGEVFWRAWVRGQRDGPSDLTIALATGNVVLQRNEDSESLAKVDVFRNIYISL